MPSSRSKMVPIGFPETSVTHHQLELRNIRRRSQLGTGHPVFHATKAQREGRGIAVPTHNFGARRGVVAMLRPQTLYPQGFEPWPVEPIDCLYTDLAIPATKSRIVRPHNKDDDTLSSIMER